MTKVGPEDSVKACYSTWDRSYYHDYYGPGATYPPVHRDLVRGLLREAGARSLLDAGCGPASLLRDLTDLGLELFGFDLTPEMVEEARRVLGEHGVPAEHVWEGSVLSPEAFRPPGGAPRQFDAAICIGVLPHIPEAELDRVFENLAGSVEPGGMVVVEGRNELFALFTQNRYSFEFFRDRLIRARELVQQHPGGAEALDRVLGDLEGHFRMDLPPTRGGKAGEPGYDQILSRTDNPLVLRERFVRAGFDGARLLFYHYHALPPFLAGHAPEVFRQASLALEDPDDWRGHFMASAFLLCGRKR